VTLLNLVVLALAVYRIARFVGWDDITRRWRERFTGWNDNQHRNEWPRNHRRIAEMIHCPFCFSLWVAILAWIAFRYYPHAVLLVAWPLAIGAAAGLLAKNLDE
jgi:hypothetical protein